MDTQNSQPAKQESTAALDPAITSCRRKKKDDATFLEDLKDHIDEFIHASMDEHKDCFTKTMKKMFGMSKIVAERSGDAKEVEISLPLQTTGANLSVFVPLKLLKKSASNTLKARSNPSSTR